jgi:VirB8 protein
MAIVSRAVPGISCNARRSASTAATSTLADVADSLLLCADGAFVMFYIQTLGQGIAGGDCFRCRQVGSSVARCQSSPCPRPRALSERRWLGAGNRPAGEARALAWFVTTIFAGITMLSLLTLVSLVPLKSFEPYIVEVDKIPIMSKSNPVSRARPA